MSDVTTENAVNNSEMMSTPKKAKTEKAQSTQHSKGFAPVFITVGQGGFNLASTLRSTFGKGTVIAINSSEQDLSVTGLPNDLKVKIGGNSNGAGKVRNDSKEYYKSYRAVKKGSNEEVKFIDMFTTLYEEVLYGPEQKVIFVCFSTAGGTGGGCGGQFTTELTSYINKSQSVILNNSEYEIGQGQGKIPRPIVIGVPILAGLDEGTVSLQNSLECCSELQKVIDRKFASFVFVDNTLADRPDYNTTEEKYQIINSRFASALLKFFGLELNSDIKCVDLQDKINSLRIPGVHSFVSLSRENRNNMFQCIIPFNQTVPRIVSILSSKESDVELLLKSRLRDYDITTDDSIIGFFDPEISGLDFDMIASEIFETSIFGLFGISNIGKIVEDIDNRLKTMMQSNDTKNDTVRTSSTGFNSIESNKEAISSKFSQGSISDSDMDDIF